MNGSDKTNKGITFLELLTIVFIALKLIGLIEWSWWWVLSPVWIPLLIGLVIAIITALSD